MNLDEMIQLQTLKLKAAMQPSHLEKMMGEEQFAQALKESKLKTRNVCALISEQLFDRFENVTSSLDLTKREFIEAALFQSVARAEAALSTLVDQRTIEGGV